MPIRVLVVDDSAFFRRRLTEIFESDSHLTVVGTAANGKEAIEQVNTLKPDVVTMDIEMPVMDGITAVRRIMATAPIPILMLSSLTTEGAPATLDALEAGAMDFLPKRMDSPLQDKVMAQRQLCARVRLVGGRKVAMQRTRSVTSKKPLFRSTSPTPKAASIMHRGAYKLVVIGTSTGGPVALQEVLTKLPARFSLPLLLVQHMPGTFTPAFAERLDKLCAISVREAQDGDALKPGLALLAPGGKQMLVTQRGEVKIMAAEPSQTYRPSVDLTFTSAAKAFSASVLAVILTGMGADGREGARALKNKGATVWAQDEASSTIYGMPAAVIDAGLADQVLPLNDVGPSIAGIV